MTELFASSSTTTKGPIASPRSGNSESNTEPAISKPSSDPQRSLETLPNEVVRMILRNLLLSSEILYGEREENNLHPQKDLSTGRKQKEKSLHPNILRCSQKYLTLGREILYGENYFGISSTSGIDWFGSYPIARLWKTYLKRLHIKITSHSSQGPELLDEEEDESSAQFLSDQRQFISRICGYILEIITSQPQARILIKIDCQDPNYQILEPFSYLPETNLMIYGAPPNYVNYLQAAGSKSALSPAQSAYRQLQFVTWSLCACQAHLGSAWTVLCESDDLQKHSEAWEEVSNHEYQKCLQKIRPNYLCHVWHLY